MSDPIDGLVLEAAVALGVLALAAAPLAGCGSDQPSGRRAPRTGAERRAADVAVRFAEVVRAGHLASACRMIGAPGLAREFRCSTTPRTPSRIRFDSDEAFKVIDVYRAYRPGGSRVRQGVGLSLRPGHPVFAVHVDAAGRVLWAGSSGYG